MSESTKVDGPTRDLNEARSAYSEGDADASRKAHTPGVIKSGPEKHKT